MKHYYPPERPMPPGTQTPLLVLEPLKPGHGELDYAAVIESREQLRLWSRSSWPADDFTLQDNLKDLQWHWREHQERVAFTFTVLDPTHEICLGCVYLRPLAELAPFNPTELANVSADETLVRFWVRTARDQSDLERQLLGELMRWLEDEWTFSRVLYETSDVNAPQINLFESSPLRRVKTLLMPRRGGRHVFYEL